MRGLTESIMYQVACSTSYSTEYSSSAVQVAESGRNSQGVCFAVYSVAASLRGHTDLLHFSMDWITGDL